MKLESLPLDKVVLDPANARTHPGRNIEAIKGSLLRFGQQKPIVIDAQNVVRAGNGTVEAARALGWKEITVVRSDLAPVDLAAFAITDNRTAELAEWNLEALASTVIGLEQQGVDLKTLGWEEFELQPLREADFTPQTPSEGLPGESGSSGDPHVLKLNDDQLAVLEQVVAVWRSRPQQSGLEREQVLEIVLREWLKR